MISKLRKMRAVVLLTALASVMACVPPGTPEPERGFQDICGPKCDQYWGGASIEDKGSAVCHKWTTMHAQDNHVKQPIIFKIGRLLRRLTIQETPKIGECRPASLPEGLNKKMALNVIARWTRAVKHPPCPAGMTLIKEDKNDPNVKPPQKQLCRCDTYHHAKIASVEDIETAGKKEGTPMCMRAEQTWDAREQKHKSITACYEPSPEFPTAGHNDGGGLTFGGCRSDMAPCQHKNAVLAQNAVCTLPTGAGDDFGEGCLNGGKCAITGADDPTPMCDCLFNWVGDNCELQRPM